MSIFTENTWDSNKIGDTLSQQLFRQKSKKAKNNNNGKIKLHKKNEKKSKQMKIKKIFNDHNAVITKKHMPGNSSDVDNLNKGIKNYSNKNKRRIENNTNKNKNESKDKKLQQTSLPLITKSKKKRLKKKQKQMLENRISKTNDDNNSPVNNVKHCKKIDINKIKELLVNKKTESGNEQINTNRSKKTSSQCLSLRERMMLQLKSSRFRFLNETLYNNESTQSLKMFKEDPESFKAYHAGYQSQVEQWPLNPLDTIISAVKKMPTDYVIADFGCGEARLASSVEQKVHSLDLVAINGRITACDMAHTPLLTNNINVVIFCLSLMGSNLEDYILEANRVLKNRGILKIADVESRFDNINKFINTLKSYGFENIWKDLSHNLFYFMDFKKVADVNRRDKNLQEIKLKPCLYKKR